MTIGDKVEVFEDPYTKAKPEGAAVVRRIRSVEREPNLTIWHLLVNFPEDGPDQVVHRTVVEEPGRVQGPRNSAPGL